MNRLVGTKIKHWFRTWEIVSAQVVEDVTFGSPGIFRTDLLIRRGTKLRKKSISGAWWG